jgi:cyclopropane fatty-acyl-phospholipid synthase-like methyltransferase
MYYNDLKYIEKKLKKEYLNTNLNLLDIGCSDGEFAELLMQKFAVIADGIEINKELANKAKKKLRTVYNKIDSNVSFQNYDVIILRGTIHYLSSNEINLILKKANKKCIIIQI